MDEVPGTARAGGSTRDHRGIKNPGGILQGEALPCKSWSAEFGVSTGERKKGGKKEKKREEKKRKVKSKCWEQGEKSPRANTALLMTSN